MFRRPHNIGSIFHDQKTKKIAPETTARVSVARVQVPCFSQIFMRKNEQVFTILKKVLF
jgi:hypothetical protein|tara:strand:+ start:786 stop:962 length:177 start_codon:yes stop_codon:yes gene_type:complete